MRLSGGVAILGEGLEPGDQEPGLDDAQRGAASEEAAGTEGEPLQGEAGSDAPC